MKESKKDKPKSEFVKERKELVIRLLSHILKINWILELGMTKRLLSKYPSIEFWNNFNVPFQIDSLKILMSEWGQKYITEKYNLFLHTQKQDKNIEISDSKLGENIVIESKPKTIKDFLK